MSPPSASSQQKTTKHEFCGFFHFCKHSSVILPAESGKKPHKKMNGCWRAATTIWGKRIFIFKEHNSPFPVRFSNIKSKCYVFFLQKLKNRGNLYNKVSPLDWKGKLSEHKKCVFCTRRSLKVSTKMNKITTEVFSPRHNLAVAWFEVKITSHGVMEQQGGFLLESAEELTPKMSHQGRDLPDLCLNCSPARNLQFWEQMERREHIPQCQLMEMWCEMN